MPCLSNLGVLFIGVYHGSRVVNFIDPKLEACTFMWTIAEIAPMYIRLKQQHQHRGQFATFLYVEVNTNLGFDLRETAHDLHRPTDCRWASSNTENWYVYMKYPHVCLDAWSETCPHAECRYYSTSLLLHAFLCNFAVFSSFIDQEIDSKLSADMTAIQNYAPHGHSRLQYTKESNASDRSLIAYLLQKLQSQSHRLIEQKENGHIWLKVQQGHRWISCPQRESSTTAANNSFWIKKSRGGRPTRFCPWACSCVDTKSHDYMFR